MALAAGTQLGPYEIVELCGKGGMGEVYRARDRRLDRDVAIKVLPAELGQDPTFKLRLEREAKTISRLQHPNVCTLYDASFDGARDYLVMEFLAGETLGDRLRRGALPLEDLVRVGAEIAEALAAAHRLGIVHRDLKPGNVMLTRTGAKVLDFGLAKGFEQELASGLSESPTIAQPLTAQGTIAGTLHYMSPEQLEGREVDARSDLWALGCVLYEMASGERAFGGESAARAIAAVMTGRPRPVSERRPGSPRRLDWLIERCLERDSERRWQSAKDVALELEALGAGLFEDEASGVRGESRVRSESPILRVSLELPAGARLTRADIDMSNPLALSPDGSLVFAAVCGGESRLYRRSLDDFATEPIAGTEGASSPFFSPDGRWLGFYAAGWLQKIPASGGTVVPMRKLPSFVGTGIDWGEGDQLVVSLGIGSGLAVTSADGHGGLRQVTRLDEERAEWHHAWPQLLPGGRHVLFTVWGWKTGGATVVSLDTGEVRLIHRGAMGARLIAPDLLVFRSAFGPELLAASFDPDRLELVGEPRPVEDGIYQTPRSGGSGTFCVSPGGSLVYEPAGSGKRSLLWIDLEGRVIERLGEPGRYEGPAISPDGRRVAFSLNEMRVMPGRGSSGSGGDLWVHDLERGTRDRLTQEGDNAGATWSPDGEHIAFASNRAGPWNLYSMSVDGGLEAHRLVETSASVFNGSFTPDGAVLSFVQMAADGSSVGMVSREGEILSGEGRHFPGMAPAFSPDGRLLAYTADESGHQEVYVRPFPPTGQRFKISLQGGTEPRFSPSGREIFYRRGDELWVVPIETAPGFRPGRPRFLFTGPFEADMLTNYDVAPDGERLLMVEREPDRPLRMVMGWVDELRRLLARCPPIELPI